MTNNKIDAINVWKWYEIIMILLNENENNDNINNDNSINNNNEIYY